MPANLSAANQRENLRLSNSATSATFAWVSSGRLLSAVLTGLVHVLDRGLVHHKIGSAHAIYLQAVLVIPFDDSMDLFSIPEHDNHGSFRLHLLLVIKTLGVGLLGRRRLPTAPVAVAAVGPLRAALGHRRSRVVVLVAAERFGTIQGGTNQFPVGESVRFDRWLN